MIFLLSLLRKINLDVFFLSLLALAIGLTPRIPVGTIEGLGRIIELRGEDLIIACIFFVWLFRFLQKRQLQIKKQALFFPILFWLGIGFFSLLLNFLLGNIHIPRGIFYFGKEVEFFIVYWYVFAHTRDFLPVNVLIRVWLGVAVLNILWVLYQLVDGRYLGEYGTSALNEWGVFPMGSFFLLLFTFLFNWWLYAVWRTRISRGKEYVYFVPILFLIVGMLGALSRTVMLGFLAAVLLSFLMYILRSKTASAVYSSFLLFMVIAFFTVFTYMIFIPFTLHDDYSKTRLLKVGPNDLVKSRLEGAMTLQFNEMLRQYSPSEYLVGRGKGVILAGSESHNQFLRNLIETGIAGSIAFIVLIAAIIMKVWQGFWRREENALVTGLAAGVFVATLSMLFVSLVTDAFIVAKANMLYWFFVGLTMGAFSLKR